eukprot:452900_1
MTEPEGAQPEGAPPSHAQMLYSPQANATAPPPAYSPQIQQNVIPTAPTISNAPVLQQQPYSYLQPIQYSSVPTQPPAAYQIPAQQQIPPQQPGVYQIQQQQSPPQQPAAYQIPAQQQPGVYQIQQQQIPPQQPLAYPAYQQVQPYSQPQPQVQVQVAVNHPSNAQYRRQLPSKHFYCLYLFACISCCFFCPVGICSLYCAAKANDQHKKGDLNASSSYQRKACVTACIAIVIFVVLMLTNG